MADFHKISEKIFAADLNIRGMAFIRFDGVVLFYRMRPGVTPLSPPGLIGQMDAEVLLPALSSYFRERVKYFGNLKYIVSKFEKISVIYVVHNNIFMIFSVGPNINTYPIVEKVKAILEENLPRRI